MDATQAPAGLPHICDSPDSTIEPVGQQDIPPQPHGIPASPEELEDISPRPHGIPASPEDQEDIPPQSHGIPASPEAQEDIPPRPHGIPASPEEQEDIPPRPHGIPASAEEQEDISTGHADISPGHTEHPLPDDRNASAEHSDQDNGPCCSSDNGAGRSSSPTICTSYSQIGKETTAAPDDDWIRPYAVGYQRDAETNGDQEDVYGVQPYAVAYDEQGGHYENQTWTGHAGTSADAEGLRPNPMYSGNGLRSNPMYAPNAAQPREGGDTTTDDATQHVNYTSSPPTSTAGKGNKDLEQTRIVFGGVGEGPGEFMEEGGLTVSPSNEIFVGNPYMRRVQVFSMTGVYLRQFPAITSTEEVDPVEPADLAMDGEGHLWLIGKYITSWSGVLVRFTKTGEHLATFRPSFHNNSFFGIAVDALREHVIVTESWRDYSEVKVLHFNGSVVRRFRTEPGPQYPGGVAVGREGNLFVTNFLVDTRVYVYDNASHFLFSFGGEDFGERQTVRVMDVCTDSSGNALVAEGYGGTVEMFTQDGRYVRRVAGSTFSICSVAVAPGGQLVVTDDENSTVSVFSHY
uniref:SMP-30/Gluconolactonase/LRE-like region domain-containing protein n=1 Tax=Branchiostoma floridae TaxID=7739 RepID=C3XR24_BRAFL|eukprot:XP_002613133.1 hypothetical protein BRAFLDRAFT_73037 [Branchiostoma floridae]